MTKFIKQVKNGQEEEISQINLSWYGYGCVCWSVYFVKKLKKIKYCTFFCLSDSFKNVLYFKK